ncbi:MAG: aminopeptidase P family protein [Pseudomonadota bacterium]
MTPPPNPDRPQFFARRDGTKAPLPFSSEEYERRLGGLRAILSRHGLDAALLTSMHNIAYHTGFLYCSFGRPFAAIVTQNECITVTPSIDGSQPWRRSVGDNLIYTDWERGNFWRAVKHVLGNARRIGIESDHLTLSAERDMKAALESLQAIDIAGETMALRMVKSPEEIALIKEGARIADLGGAAIREAVRVGAREVDVAMAGRDAMEREIARSFPDSELRDTWVWFQSGLNTDGAHNPLTARELRAGDLLSLNAFAMISGYYIALERTMHLGEPDGETLRLWEALVRAHELGISAIKPGRSCAAVCDTVNAFLREENLLQYRSFGYGHSFGVLSHYYGREAGLELREDIETVLEPGMVVSMEPMFWIPEGEAGAGGYREHDILVLTEDGAENITGFPYGPQHNVIGI